MNFKKFLKMLGWLALIGLIIGGIMTALGEPSTEALADRVAALIGVAVEFFINLFNGLVDIIEKQSSK